MRSEHWLILVALLLSVGLALGGSACDSGDDDDDDDDTGDDDDDDDTQAPNLPDDHDQTANCISCHANAHDGAYNEDTIPDKCLECHTAQ